MEKKYFSTNEECKIMPIKVQDILNREVRIAECYARDNICEKRVRNDYFNIAQILQLISKGYNIIASDKAEELEQFFQQVILIEFYYGNRPNFKKDLLNNNILPTFIIEHEGPSNFCGLYEDYAILGYCFNEAIRSEKLKEDISSNLHEILFNSKGSENEIDSYNAYDYGSITNVTITNNLYVPAVGGIANDKE